MLTGCSSTPTVGMRAPQSRRRPHMRCAGASETAPAAHAGGRKSALTASHLVDDLRRLCGAVSVLDDSAARQAAGTDFVGLRGVPAAVVRATSDDQVASLLAYASQRGVAV